MNCLNCHQNFEFSAEDQLLLQKLSPVIDGQTYTIDPPKLCNFCREMRRLAFRNQNKLYKRACNLCNKEIVSMYKAEIPHTVYCNDCWWSDQWDSLQYGQEFDFNRPFFEQFLELKLKVPHLALHASHNENSDYVNLSGYNKNCYLLYAAEYNEDCQYSTQIQNSKKCLDCLYTYDSQFCYEVVDVANCYNVSFSQNCKNCSDSMFIYDCQSSKNCLFSVNLRNKEYCIFNRQYSREEFEIKKSEILKSGRLQELLKNYYNLIGNAVHKNLEVTNCENSFGNYLLNCQNVFFGFDCNDAQDCRYVTTGVKCKDAMDCSHIYDVEKVYEGTSVGYGSNSVLFAMGAWSSNNVTYVDNVHHSGDLFGCVGIIKKQYCILNKQYTREQYFELVPKIIAHMKQIGEWGEFFPFNVSPFVYAETLANEYFPMPNSVSPINAIHQSPVLHADSICCGECKKYFRLNFAETEFYKSMNLPMPANCSDCRHRHRFLSRRKRALFRRNCCKCGTVLLSTFAESRPEKVYCEECYLEEVY